MLSDFRKQPTKVLDAYGNGQRDKGQLFLNSVVNHDTRIWMVCPNHDSIISNSDNCNDRKTARMSTDDSTVGLSKKSTNTASQRWTIGKIVALKIAFREKELGRL